MSESQKENGGAGPEGTIPGQEDGVGAATTDEPTSFEPEEDPEAAEDQGNS